MNTTQSTYDQQANEFLAVTNTTFKAEYLRTGKYFPDDKEERDIYNITLVSKGRSYSFEFGQSPVNSGFYFTEGKKKTPLNRNLMNKSKSYLTNYIKQKISWNYLNNGKSDVIHYPKEPTAYDVLACLTKNEPGTFEDFCSEFGYDTDSRKAEKIYKAVKDEYLNVCRLFNESELDLLREIQ